MFYLIITVVFTVASLCVAPDPESFVLGLVLGIMLTISTIIATVRR